MTMPAFDPFDEEDRDEEDEPILVDEAFRPAARACFCRVCGCTENDGCIGADGLPCHWVTPTLCSACLEI